MIEDLKKWIDLCDTSPKLDREKVLGRWMVQHQEEIVKLLTPDPTKITVSAAPLRTLLIAVLGQPHEIRELQAIRSLGDSPIDQLRDEYNDWQKK